MKNISAKYIGLTTAAAMVAAALVLFYVFHFPENGKNQYFIYAIYAVGILTALILFNKKTGDETAFKNYFSEGFKVFVVVTLIMAVFTFIFYKMNPEIMENASIEISKYNSKDTNRTPAEVQQNAKNFNDVFNVMMVATNVFKNLVLGALITIIAAGFLSQKKSV